MPFFLFMHEKNGWFERGAKEPGLLRESGATPFKRGRWRTETPPVLRPGTWQTDAVAPTSQEVGRNAAFAAGTENQVISTNTGLYVFK